MDRWRVWFPRRTAKIVRHGSFNPGDSQHGLGIVWIHAVPESPQILQCCVALAVEEGVLQAIGLVPREAVGDIDHVARFQPSILVHHGYKRIVFAFPRHPIIPADVRPGEGFIAWLELRLKRKRMSASVRRLAKLG